MTLIGALLFVTLMVCLYTLHKVRKIHLMSHSLHDSSERNTNDLYHQLEILIGLYVDLGLTKSLSGTRGWAASPDFLMELVKYARREKPTTVVECSSGTSTLVLARCMQLNGGGKVYSLEHDPVYAQQTTLNLARHGLSEFAEVILAPLESLTASGESWSWYEHKLLPDTGPIDMLVIDGPPTATGPLARYPAGPALFPRLSGHASVFLDDAARPSEQSILARWKTEFPQLLFSSAFCEKGCAILRRSAAA
ncbi:MAG: class I SAM-dependent methyltransferase [Massilia sp.]